MVRKKEKIILGIDPGTTVMGYGLLLDKDNQLQLVQYGVIHLGKYSTHELKLRKIFDQVLNIIENFHPDEMALEAPFYGCNIQSMLKLGRAQGVAMSVALSRDIPITEYAPKKVKSSITGNGNASKEQVAAMLQKLLKFEHTEKLLDATDALAVAVCHHFQKENDAPRSKNWKAFLNANPNRQMS